LSAALYQNEENDRIGSYFDFNLVGRRSSANSTADGSSRPGSSNKTNTSRVDDDQRGRSSSDSVKRSSSDDINHRARKFRSCQSDCDDGSHRQSSFQLISARSHAGKSDSPSRSHSEDFTPLRDQSTLSSVSGVLEIFATKRWNEDRASSSNFQSSNGEDSNPSSFFRSMVPPLSKNEWMNIPLDYAENNVIEGEENDEWEILDMEIQQNIVNRRNFNLTMESYKSRK
jgi:hypothetical protein